MVVPCYFSRMVAWTLVRFGAAAQLMGHPVKASLPFTRSLAPELLAHSRVTLGSDLDTIGLGTRIALAADPDVVERAATALRLLSGGKAVAWWRHRIVGATQVELAMYARPTSFAFSFQQPVAGLAASVAPPRAPLPEVAAELASRLGRLAERVDRVTDDWSPLGVRVRAAIPTEDPAEITTLLDRAQIPAAQRNYFTDTAAVWSLWNPQMTARVAFGEDRVIDEVGVTFRDVPGEHLVRAWRTFQPRAEFAQRIGAFVGAMGVEVAERFEIRFQRTGEPQLEAVFAPADRSL
ncbi:MAG: hypothetical protein ACTHU0_36880 [Kofleriaceae bacterium]